MDGCNVLPAPLLATIGSMGDIGGSDGGRMDCIDEMDTVVDTSADSAVGGRQGPQGRSNNI